MRPGCAGEIHDYAGLRSNRRNSRPSYEALQTACDLSISGTNAFLTKASRVQAESAALLHSRSRGISLADLAMHPGPTVLRGL